MNNQDSNRRRVVIIGGGFAGLFAARALRRAPVEVTLIDRAEHHLFQPLLYQCATGILSEGKITASTRAARAVGPSPARSECGLPGRVPPVRLGAMIAVAPVAELMEVEGYPLALARNRVACALAVRAIRSALCPDALRAANVAHAGLPSAG
jgi:Pyridine nucleotide-disulphide oxidoreductase